MTRIGLRSTQSLSVFVTVCNITIQASQIRRDCSDRGTSLAASELVGASFHVPLSHFVFIFVPIEQGPFLLTTTNWSFFTFLSSSNYHDGVLCLTNELPEDSVGRNEQLALKRLTLRALHKEVESYTGQKPVDSIIGCMQ